MLDVIEILCRFREKKDAEVGATGHEVERKANKMIYGCGERGHGISQYEGKGCRELE